MKTEIKVHKLKPHKWHIFKINCDCACYTWIRQRFPAYNRFIRCRLCNKQIGDMEYRYIGTVIAKTESQAGLLFREGKYERPKV